SGNDRSWLLNAALWLNINHDVDDLQKMLPRPQTRFPKKGPSGVPHRCADRGATNGKNDSRAIARGRRQPAATFLCSKYPFRSGSFAFTVNRGNRLAKTPKPLWLGSGFAAHLAGFPDAQMLVSGRSWGPWLEAWVGHHLRTWASMKAPRPE